MQSYVGLICSVLAATTPAVPGPASPPTGEPENGVSPAQLIPRLEIRHRFAQTSSGAHLEIATVRMDVLFLRRVLLRYDLPYATQESSGARQSGLGDIRLESLTLLTSGARQASVLSAGLVLDTASRAALGAGKQQLFFGAGAALMPPRWPLFYAVVREQLSFAGAAARSSVNFLDVDSGAVLFLGRGEWLLLNFDGAVDFSADQARLTGVAEAGSLLVGRFGLFVRGGTQLLGARRLDYLMEAGVRYLFRLGKP